MAEAFEHEAAHGGQEPWKLPRSWHDRKSKLDLTTPLNFAGTADGVGGNSGSPVVNRAGEVVGLIFDSNIPALANEFRHSSDVGGRSISVHSAGMLESMRKIYDAGKLADELGR